MGLILGLVLVVSREQGNPPYSLLTTSRQGCIGTVWGVGLGCGGVVFGFRVWGCFRDKMTSSRHSSRRVLW